MYKKRLQCSLCLLFIFYVSGKVIPLMENGVLHVSILTMIAVTVERYNALCRPFKRRMSYTMSATIKSLAVIWILGITSTIPFYIMTVHEQAKFYDGTAIHVCRTKIDVTWKYLYTVFNFVVFFVIPFILLVVIYMFIIRQLTSDTLSILAQNDRSALKTIRARKQVVYMLIFIIVLFFVTLFPIRVVTMWLIFTPPEHVYKIGLEGHLNLISLARILMYINSAGNPIIYSLTSTKFKLAFRRLFSKSDQGSSDSNYTCEPPYCANQRTQARQTGNNDNYIPLEHNFASRSRMLTEKTEQSFSSCQ